MLNPIFTGLHPKLHVNTQLVEILNLVVSSPPTQLLPMLPPMLQIMFPEGSPSSRDGAYADNHPPTR